MKALAAGFVASMFDVEVLSSPYNSLIDVLDKKAAYIQKRIDRLKQYNEEAESGKKLSEIQEDARKKLGEVEQQMDYVKFLSKTVAQIQKEYNKALKERDLSVKKQLVERRQDSFNTIIEFKEMATQLNRPDVRKYFQTGSNGAELLSTAELEVMGELQSLFAPTMDDCKTNEDWIKKKSNAAKKVADIVGEETERVIMEFTGKDVFDLLCRVKNCKYFTESRFANRKDQAKKISKKNKIEKAIQEQPKITSVEASSEETVAVVTEQLVAVSEVVDSASATEVTSLIELRKIVFGYDEVNAVKNEVEEDPQAFEETSAPESIEEAAPVHVHEPAESPDASATPSSDSGNGTVTPSSEENSSRTPEQQKSNNGGKNRRANDHRQNRLRPQRGFRNENGPVNHRRTRPYRERNDHHESYEKNGQWAHNGHSSHENAGYSRKTYNRSYTHNHPENGCENRNYGYGRHEVNENGYRGQNGGSSGNVAGYSNGYVNGGGYRRSAPTTCGLVFGNARR